MNNHLTKKYKYTTIKDLLLIIIIYLALIYLFPIDKFTIVIVGIVFVYRMFQKQKILLEIKHNENVFSFISYTIFGGIKKYKFELERIIEIDFDGQLIISCKDDYGKTTEIFKLTAEPWNNLYEQIKEFKIKYQDFEKINKKKG